MQSPVSPDIFANVKLYPTSEGGKRLSITGDFSCPAKIGETFYDCRMFLEKRLVSPGTTEMRVPIKFLNWPDVKPLLQKGTTFFIWEGKIVGEATVDELLI